MHVDVMLGHRSAPVHSTTPDLKRSRAQRFVGAMCGLAMATASAALQAGVLQRVDVIYAPPSGAPVVDTDSVFAETSAGIDRDILASTGIPFEHQLTATAGRFGQVGLQAFVQSGPPGSVYSTEVLIGSDEYVNVFGSEARVRTTFIVDGGVLQDFFSRFATVRFELQVGAESRGFQPAEDRENFLKIDADFAADFGASGLYPGGGYIATLSSDGMGNRSFTSSVTGGLDLRATFDGLSRVDIPLSLQTLDLGILQPGERLLLGYRAIITIEHNGAIEGLGGQYADPITLSGEPNPVFRLDGVTITPVPEPRMALLCLAGLAVIALRRRLRAGS